MIHQMQPSPDRERIELFMSARALKNKDILGASDPKCKVYYKAATQAEKLVGQTEAIKDQLNPDWKKTIEIDYIFEIAQVLRFEVWDVDAEGSDDLIGYVQTSVGELMGSRNQVITLPLKKDGKDGKGWIIIKADQVKIDSNYIKWQWKGHKLLNTDGLFGKSDPFIIFFRKKDDQWLRVHETPYIKDTLNPLWPPFEIPLLKLNGGNPLQQFRIECWDNSKSGKHNFIGSYEVSIHDLLNTMMELKLKNPKEKDAGKLILVTHELIRKPSFIDYLQGGEQINMVVAVDFTGSNGNPQDPHSLHSIVPGAYNQYQTALYQVGSILLNYDFDKKVPLYGFGGVPKFPNFTRTTTEHCFPLTGSFESPEVHELKGIMDYYSGALQYVSLSGPTYFGPVLEYAMGLAKKNKESEQDVYTVLLIITDGEIHDFEKSAEIILKCVLLPISVIIIGVGSENFTQMRKLDGDDGPLKGHKAGSQYRDLVQFVAFQDHKTDPGSLANAVLAELPGQLVAYKALMGKPPRQHIDVHLSQMKIQ